MPDRPDPQKGVKQRCTDHGRLLAWAALSGMHWEDVTLPRLLPSSVFDGQRSACRFLPTASPGNGKFGNFLLGMMADILCGSEGTSLDRVSSSALPARCNIAHGAVAQGRAGVSRVLQHEGVGSWVTRQAYPWALLLFNAKKWGEGSCKHSGCIPCVCTIETRSEESCELCVRGGWIKWAVVGSGWD